MRGMKPQAVVLIVLCSSVLFVSCTVFSKRSDKARAPSSVEQRVDQIAQSDRGLRFYIQVRDCRFHEQKVLQIVEISHPFTPAFSDRDAFQGATTFKSPAHKKENFPHGLMKFELTLENNERYVGFAPQPLIFVHESSGYEVKNCSHVYFVDIPIPQEKVHATFQKISAFIYQDAYELRNVDGKEAFIADLSEVPIEMEVKEISRSWVSHPSAAIQYPAREGPHRIVPLRKVAPPEEALDLVILGDGFSKEELSLESDEAVLRSRFGQTAKASVEHLLLLEPFKSLKEHINVTLIATLSEESGVTDLNKGVRRKSYYGLELGAGCVKSVLMAKNLQRALDVASLVPMDSIYIFANSSATAGTTHSYIATGTISLSVDEAKYTFAHELGHTIGSLADTYNIFSIPSLDSRNPSSASCAHDLHGQYATTKWGAPWNIDTEEHEKFYEDKALKSPLSLARRNRARDQAISPLYPDSYSLSEFDGESNLQKLHLNFDMGLQGHRFLYVLSRWNKKMEWVKSIELNGQPTSFIHRQVALESLKPTKKVELHYLELQDLGKIEELSKTRTRLTLVFDYPLTMQSVSSFAQLGNQFFQLLKEPTEKPYEFQYVALGRSRRDGYRMSYLSIMTTELEPQALLFNTVEREILLNQICSYIRSRDQIPSCKVNKSSAY